LGGHGFAECAGGLRAGGANFLHFIQSGLDAFGERLRGAFAADVHEINLGLVVKKVVVQGGDVEAVFERGAHDTVIVGGGDGTASTAVAAFATSSKVLGVLPFGTMNLLARDLGMPMDIDDAVAALAEVAPRPIDLAEINGRPFHTLSGLGFFSQMARAREEARGHPLGRFASLTLAWFRALRRTKAFTIDIDVDGRRERVPALAVLVTNNRFGPDWRRARLDEGVLEMHLVEDQGTLTKLKASAALLTGAWRTEQQVRSITGSALTVTSGSGHASASTDGELIRERVPLRFRVLPRRLTVLSRAS
jgi:diacylglycerol kinase family enzyme